MLQRMANQRQSAERWARIKQDPEAYEHEKKMRREYSRRRREVLKNDPVWRQARIEAQRRQAAKRKEQRHNDPEYAAKQREYHARWRAKRNADPVLLEKHKEYMRAYRPQWRDKNRSKLRKDSLAYYHRNRAQRCDESHWRNVKRRYGLTRDQYEQIIQSQGGGCAICGIVDCPSGKRLAIDHCHNSRIVRGVLCEQCNVLLGRIEARGDGWMNKALAYLANPPAAILNAKADGWPAGRWDHKPGGNWKPA